MSCHPRKHISFTTPKNNVFCGAEDRFCGTSIKKIRSRIEKLYNIYLKQDEQYCDCERYPVSVMSLSSVSYIGRMTICFYKLINYWLRIVVTSIHKIRQKIENCIISCSQFLKHKDDLQSLPRINDIFCIF